MAGLVPYMGVPYRKLRVSGYHAEIRCIELVPSAKNMGLIGLQIRTDSCTMMQYGKAEHERGGWSPPRFL